MKKRVVGRPRGEDYLDQIDGIQILLENGATVELHLSDEIGRIPREPGAVEHELLRIDARLAFWAYQTVRAQHHMKKVQAELEEAEGMEYAICRTWIRDHMLTDVVTEANIRSQMSRSTELKAKKLKALEAEKSYAVLRAVADALRDRGFTLRALLKRESEAGEG